MANTLLNSRQTQNAAALPNLGSVSANTTLDQILGTLNTNTVSAATASTLMLRDSSANVRINNLIENFTTIATAAGTTTLLVSSTYYQQFTGSTTQTVVLPNATTLVIGQSFAILNRSTGYVTVNANGGGLIQSMAPNTQAIVMVTNIGSSAGTWDVAYSIASPIPFLQTNVITDSTTTGSAATLQAGDILDGVARLTNGSLVSVSGIPAGGSGQFITIENQTGNTITINNNDSGASSANRLFTGTGANVTMSSNASFQFVYDVTQSKWMLVGGTGSGSGSGAGSKNYLSVYTASTSSNVPNTGNGNFELGSTSGWSLAHSALTSFAPTSVATPGSAFSSSSGGSAASGNLSLSVVSSGQLAGSYSGSLASSAASTAGDLLISSAFFIDLEDEAKIQTVKFYYSTFSGAANLNFSGTSSNSFAVWIYDVTNGAWIQPAGVYNLVQNSGVGYCTATFQTTSNSTKYQLALININASAGAYTFYIDDFFLGPQTAPIGAVISDWQQYVLNITGTISNPTKATSPLDDTAMWRRVGDSIEISYTYQQSSATGATAGSGNYIWGLPPGIVIDTTKLAAMQTSGTQVNTSGPATIMYAGTTTLGGYVRFEPGVGIYMYSSETPTGYTIIGSANRAINGNAIVGYSFTLRLPVSGWSSNTIVSSDTDTRIVAAQATGASNSVSTTLTLVTFTTTTYDTHGSITTGASWKYSIPVSGYYRISGTLAFSNMSIGVGGIQAAVVYKNGVAINTGSGYETASSGSFAVIVPYVYEGSFKAGDYVQIYGYNNTTTTLDTTNSTFNISRESGPAVIAATDETSARYYASSTSLSGSLAIINWTTQDYDTHGGMLSGTYTIPSAGKYHINSALLVAATFALNNTLIMEIQKNGSVVSRYTDYAGGAETNMKAIISDIIKCIAGDTITIQVSTSGTGPSIVSSNFDNYISIAKTGKGS